MMDKPLNWASTLDWLDEFSQQLAEYKREQAKGELKKASLFTPFQFIKTDEMGLSALIAFLLDTKGNHAQERLFIDQFLRQQGLFSFLGYETVEVAIEKTLQNSLRRHDILLIGRLKGEIQWVISIENKLCCAPDQPEQVKDYIHDIKQYHKENHLLIYLTIEGEEPSEDSISSSDWKKWVDAGKAKTLSASELTVWLEHCIAYAPNVEMFIQQFVNYLKENVMGMNNENVSQWVNDILESEQRLEAALTIIRSQAEFYHQLMEKLFNQMEEKGKKSNQLKAWNADRDESPENNWARKYKQIFFDSPNGKISMGICSNPLKFKDWYFWVQINEGRNKKQIQKIQQYLQKSEPYNNGEEQGIWFWLDHSYRDWEAKDSTAWADILNGKLAEYIIKKLEEIHFALEKEELL